MTDLDPIERMWQRVQQCRRLAASLTNERASSILLQMADEGEADIKRLLIEREQRGHEKQL